MTLPKPPMPESRTLPALLAEMARRHPEAEALIGGTERYTYAALLKSVRELAKGFYALGVRPGDKVAILAGNRVEWVIADLAIVQLGGVLVALNTWATARELEYMLRHSEVSVLVMVERFLKYDYLACLASFEPRAERLPDLREVVVLADRAPPGSIAWSALLARGAAVADSVIDAIAVAPEDIAYLLYTSGSTAAPKGVPLQHYALVENMWHIGERMHVGAQDRLWLAVSLFWGLGCENALLNMLTHGACTVLQENFEPGEALELIERERCTVIYATPNMAQALLEHPDRGRRDLSSLRTGGTIGTPEQIERLVALGATEICNIYGATETYGNCAVTDGWAPLDRRLVSVGEPLPGVRVRIVDPESGAELPAGETGEIRVEGYVMPGYLKDAALNAKSFDADGFFITGDLGFLDEEGWLFFRGRLKEMVKTGGINVAPVEVEEILMTHPAVRLAYVVGVPDAVRDEVIAAVIVPRHGQTVDAAELAAHCRDVLAAYKCPRLYRFVDEDALPLTTTGKLEKRRLPAFFAGGEG